METISCFEDILNAYGGRVRFQHEVTHQIRSAGDVMESQDLALGSCSSEELEESCSLCSRKFDSPRVLSCLHVFCEECLEKHYGSDGLPDSVLHCPDCGQDTKMGIKGISGLPIDYITSNKLDMEAIENMQITCTSCKAKEKAMARCTECATFLCNNCVTAHQYMRCFENHKVVTFEDMKGAGDGFSIHKPVTCLVHPEESMKYYCHTCHIPICNECMVADHKQPDHHYEKACEAEPKQREELKNLVAESQSKVKLCEDASSTLNTYLSELQLQRDNAKSHIEETFQSYKSVLEKHQEQLLKSLDSVHSNLELQVMDTFHNMDKIVEKIDDACKFADRLLAHGNTLELLSLKHIVGSQLLSLINNTPKLEVSARIGFETDEAKFEAAVKENFGCISQPKPPPPASDDTPQSQKVSPLHSSSSFECDELALPTGVADASADVGQLDVDFTNNIVVQYLAQLAGFTENSAEKSPNSASSPMEYPDLLTAQVNAMNNLQALAKIGFLDGQAPNLSIDTSSIAQGSIQSPPLRLPGMCSINASSPTESLESMLNGGSLVTSPREGSPLDGNLLDGSSMIGYNMQNPSIMPPSAISPLSRSNFNPTPRNSAVKLNTMQIRCKFGQLGPGKCQFSSPHGFCLGLDEEIIVADTNNHRIQVFDKTGDFKYQFGVAGKEEGQLWYPRKVAVIRSSGKFVICDRGTERSRMQIFTKSGHFLKKIPIRYMDIVSSIATTREGNIVTVDSVSPTVFIISETGVLLQWFDCSSHMREPSDIAVSGKEFFVCDFKGHCVIVFSETGQFLRKIGNENITNFPNGIDISDAGDVLVGDSHGNRFHIVVFSRQGNVLSEFECPYVKVSRCCGLKITSEGYVVTLAKNNHHVLILNTLYIV